MIIISTLISKIIDFTFLYFENTLDLLFIFPVLCILIAFIHSVYDTRKEETINITILFATLSFLQTVIFVTTVMKNLTKDSINISEFKYFPKIISIGNNIDFYVIIDNISGLHLLITSFVIFICVIHVICNAYKKKGMLLGLLFLIQLLLYIGFSCPNFFIFYVCFEASLIPFFILIATWGSREEFRIASAFRLMFYTLVFSAPLFISLIFLFSNDRSFDFTHIKFFTTQITFLQKVFVLSALLSFFVKVPLIPFHSWLPDAHSEAPTIGSMLLAGVILKLGTYGLYRVMWPYTALEQSSLNVELFMFSAAIFTALVSCYLLIREIDMKRIIALYSINHMSFVVLGFCTTHIGLSGSMIINASHCFSSVGLFFLVGQLYSRFHDRTITELRGIGVLLPIFSFFFVVLFLANMSFPGTFNFFGEFFVISSLNVKFMDYYILITSSTSITIDALYKLYWFFLLICSLILVGITTVRLLTNLLFGTRMFLPDTNFFRDTQFNSTENDLDTSVSSSESSAEHDTTSYPAHEDMQFPEIITIVLIFLFIITPFFCFDDISLYFDPKLSYSSRLFS